MPRVEVNTPAPPFTLTDLEGNEVSLSDYAGDQRVLVVLNRGLA